MPVRVFKSLRFYFAYPLTKLINTSFINGIFPSNMKIARLTPVFKKGDKFDPNNYRPISSLPFISKIIERCVSNRILSFFDHTDFLSKFQYGFRRGKSTTLSLIELTENIYNSLKKVKTKNIHFLGGP